ncbi:hypothetical protein NECAME_09288 [Necator americanus]|uniref:Uncharacterized protein n=1 Tax=Necator americanus TaxID=51031 RepID=W2TDV1_NECAM|nr:hypothetical protein NECAME_09288 [Necator americanus]ETN80235.1 hypothetical protein NECAME_09288 [Necator americanus]
MYRRHQFVERENSSHRFRLAPELLGNRGQEMTDAMALKTQLLNNLSKFLVPPTTVNAVDVLRDVFNLSTHCRVFHKNPKSLFASEEQERFRHDLLKALPQFNISLVEHLTLLGLESATTFRRTRSGLQFLKDDFIVGDKDLEREFDVLMDSGSVTRIELNLEDWKDDRAEWDTGADPEDLRGVPDSHDWWTEAERGDSWGRFGMPAEHTELKKFRMTIEKALNEHSLIREQEKGKLLISQEKIEG